MREIETHRTLVKSLPELWAEVGDEETLARHLDAFAPVRITRAEPDATVDWEGERVRGTIRLEPSGFGTRVVLTAESDHPGPDPGRLNRWLRRPPSPEGFSSGATLRALRAALDSLGRAHHRPFSR